MPSGSSCTSPQWKKRCRCSSGCCAGRGAPHDGIRQYKREAEQLEGAARERNHAQAFSGDVPRRRGCASCANSTRASCTVLIATDVASRGLHIPDVSHVFNYDLPQDSPTTCIASAARHAPARSATPSASPARNTPSPCRRSRITSPTRRSGRGQARVAGQGDKGGEKECDPEDGPSGSRARPGGGRRAVRGADPAVAAGRTSVAPVANVAGDAVVETAGPRPQGRVQSRS